MSGKINVIAIVKGHFKTFVDVDGAPLAWDYFTFIGVPIICSVLSLLAGFKLDKDAVSLLVNFGAIFTALLLSVLVLVYDQESKLDDRQEFARLNNLAPDLQYLSKKELLGQLYFNISFSVVYSLALVAICFLYSVAGGVGKSHPSAADCLSYVNLGLTSVAVFLSVSSILVVVMIVKRMHTLLVVGR